MEKFQTSPSEIFLVKYEPFFRPGLFVESIFADSFQFTVTVPDGFMTYAVEYYLEPMNLNLRESKFTEVRTLEKTFSVGVQVLLRRPVPRTFFLSSNPGLGFGFNVEARRNAVPPPPLQVARIEPAGQPGNSSPSDSFQS